MNNEQALWNDFNNNFLPDGKNGAQTQLMCQANSVFYSISLPIKSVSSVCNLRAVIGFRTQMAVI